MNEFLEKLSSYNIFNYLLPGILFSLAAEGFTPYSFYTENIVIGVFIYYFIGLVVSRFGSLIIEPFLKKISFLKFAPYKDFVSANRFDQKIETLSEANNMYRTLCSMFILLLFFKLYVWVETTLPQLQPWRLEILAVTLFIFFIFSYRKQTDYIRKRIEAIDN